MGRILFLAFATFVLMIIFVLISSIVFSIRDNTSSSEEHRKSFEDDIDAVAKKIKENS